MNSRVTGWPVRWVLVMVVAAAIISLGTRTSKAQSARIVHTITKQRDVPPQYGRDLWLAVPQNYLDQTGKYIALFITSTANTTVHIEVGNNPSTLQDQPVAAYQVATVLMNLQWEIKTNDIIEQKGIHVWSDDADIQVYEMSHSPYTSDGMLVIPTIGWGTDYAVAGFAALDASEFSDGDEPSEFALVADQDNTLVQITPSCALRGVSSTSVGHQAGQMFTVNLNKGQCVQYKSTRGLSADEMDVTGTLIHSTVPVGVVGASQCPFIPVSYPACDHVLEMMPSMRTWSKTYYTAPFTGRKKGDTFCILGSTSGQRIYRTDNAIPKRLFATVDPGVPYWDNSTSTPCRWESDQPFMLVQYINSASWEGTGASTGDPAEVVINPVEQFAKTIIFQVPKAQGSQTEYTDYVNLIVNAKAAASTTFDGQNIIAAHYPVQSADGIYNCYFIKNLAPATTHIVKSDSGVGVYEYGYGSYESYAWAGALGTGTVSSPDTIPPAARPSTLCYTAHVDLSDMDVNASKLGDIRLDSSINMTYSLDTSWIAGAGLPSSYYDMSVLDDTKPGILQISVYDIAGNLTTIRSIYTPQIAVIGPPQLDVGVGSVAGPAIYGYDTIVNIGTTPFLINTLSLTSLNIGFTIDSGASVGETLQPGEKRIIRIAFFPVSTKTATDTIVFGDSCTLQEVSVIGSGGTGFRVDDWDFGPILLGSSGTHRVLIHNNSTVPIHITNITVDSSEFTFDPSVLANPGIVVPGRDTADVTFTFTPKYIIRDTTAGHFICAELGEQDDQLIGRGIQPENIFESSISDTLDCAHPGDSLHFLFTLKVAGSDQTFINGITHSASTDTNWKNFKGSFQSGAPVNLSSVTELDPGQEIFVSEVFVIPSYVDGTFTDTLTALSNTGPLTVTATIISASRGGTLQPSSIVFNQVPYKSSNIQSQQFVLTDTGISDMSIDSVSLEPGGKYNNAFTISTNPPLPYTLASHDSITVTVHFDPDSSFDAYQDATVQFYGNSCSFMTEGVQGQVGVSGDTILGYIPTQILSCSAQDEFVTVLNLKPHDTINDVIDTIVSFGISGADAGYFDTVTTVTGLIVHGKDSLKIPIRFIPSGSASGVYNAQVTIQMHDTRGGDITLVEPISGIAATDTVAISSNFGLAQSSTVGSTVALPINLHVTGLTDSLIDEQISAVRLQYLFNSDLLDMPAGSIANSYAPPNGSGWTVDPSGSSLTLDSRRKQAQSGVSYVDTLVLLLKNSSYLSGNMTSLGRLSFEAMLTSEDTMTNVSLDSIELLSGDSNGYTQVSGCVTTLASGGSFSLIYQCGDQTIRDFMNGQSTFIFLQPATPDPITGNAVTLRYANRGETNITISIYDVLGHEVMRPVDNVRHAAGAWEVMADVGKLPSGTYTYRITAGNAVASKQFVIQR
jgi:hypothetical protein